MAKDWTKDSKLVKQYDKQVEKLQKDGYSKESAQRIAGQVAARSARWS